MSNLKLFIVGSPRSGTSIAYYAAREILGLKGRGESHVFPIFQRIIHQFHLYKQEFATTSGVLAGSLDTRSFKEVLYPFLRDFYARTYQEGSFVDKTPGAEAIRGCGLIKEVFPEARIILMQRNGIEVVSSYRAKFTSSFENACLSWKQVGIASQQMLSAHPDILVVDQFDLTNDPEPTAGRIAIHVGKPELQRSLAEFFLNRRVEQQSTHDWKYRLTLAETDWSQEEKKMFRDICGEYMSAMGYVL